jgi:hypothetical protein
MRISPRSTLILVSICAASLGFAFASRAGNTPVARCSRMAEALPWTFIAKTGEMETARLTIEDMAFRSGVVTSSTEDKFGSRSRFADPAAKIDRFAREAAAGRKLAQNIGLLGVDALNPEAMGLMRSRTASSPLFSAHAEAAFGTFKIGAPNFKLPDVTAAALAADGARRLQNALAGDRAVAELFSIPREDLAKIYTRLWQDSFLGVQDSQPGGLDAPPDADAPAPRQLTGDVSALAL